MKNFKHISVIAGNILSATAFVATALANPAMIPNHPGHPMKPLKSPVTGQSLANDPGRSLFYGQEALSRSTQEANEDMKVLSDVAQDLKNPNEGLNIATEPQDSKRDR